MPIQKTKGRANVIPLLTTEQKTALAEKFGGTSPLTRDGLKENYRDYFTAFHKKFMEESGEKEILGVVSCKDSKAQKQLLADTIKQLKNETGIKCKLDIPGLESEKDAFGKALKNLESQLVRAINEDKTEANSGHGSKSFKGGDEIRMNQAANSAYTLTQEGSLGKVIRYAGYGDYLVEFTLLTGNRNMSRDRWEVNSQYMEHRSLKMLAASSGGVSKLAHNLVQTSVSAALVEREHEKITDLYISELLEDKFLVKMGNAYGVNQNRVFELTGGNLANAYANPKLYSSPDMFSPPAERKAHVLRLELTQGCDYNACTYCGGYKGVPYKEKSYDEFMAHYNAVMRVLGSHTDRIRRLFIGGGNALSADFNVLTRAIRFLNYELDPRRISIYGRADSIKNKGKSGLSRLRESGLNLIYWGVESGSEDVLKYVCKNTTADDLFAAGRAAELADINLSIMLMPGLGGIKYAQSHIDGTVRFLNEVKAKYITFMAVNPPSNSIYAQRMAEEIKAGTNRPLTSYEIVEQLRDIMDGMKPQGPKVGIFDQTIDQVGHNPLAFNVRFDVSGRYDALRACNYYLREHR